MKLSEIKQAAELCFRSNVTLNLVGTSGCGKTSIWGQIYKDLGFDNYTILRPALMADSGDLTGLPEFHVSEHNGVKYTTTKFMTPDFLPKDGDNTLIVLDEINRINKDLANAIFGLIEAENPTVGQYALPKGCKVVATCNPATDEYSGVLDFKDAAWSSRMSFVHVRPDQDVWNEYGKKTGKVSSLVIDFFNKNSNTFFGIGEDINLTEMFGLDIKNNNRSKEKVSKLEFAANELKTPDNILMELIAGIGGQEFASAFMDFRKNYATIVNFEDVIAKKENAEKFDYSQISNISKVLDEAKDYFLKNDFTSKRKAANFSYFLENIPTDTLFSFLNSLVISFVEKEVDNKKVDALYDLIVTKNIEEKIKDARNSMKESEE